MKLEENAERILIQGFLRLQVSSNGIGSRIRRAISGEATMVLLVTCQVAIETV